VTESILGYWPTKAQVSKPESLTIGDSLLRTESLLFNERPLEFVRSQCYLYPIAT